jgi:hypothetical protein
MCHGDRRRSIERLVELAVYAPLGLATIASERIPPTLDRGRRSAAQRLVLARAIGKMVAEQGERQLRRRFDPAVVAPVDSIDAPPTAPSRPTTDTAAAPVAAPVVSIAAEALPIDDYESLAASHVVARLASLTPDERDVVARFETANRNRRTILGRLDQLRAHER